MDRSNEFDLLLKLYRQTLTPAERKRSANPKSPFFLYPVATERLYATQISMFMKKFTLAAKDRIESYIKSWLSDTKKDDFTDDFAQFKSEMEEELETMYLATFALDSPSYLLLVEIADKVFNHAKKQWVNQTKPIVGLEWQSDFPEWDNLRKTWIRNNQTIMEKQAKDFLSTVEVLIITALQSFWTYQQFEESFNKLTARFIGPRSELLARNEVAILNTQILRNMYAEAGMPYYIWHTAMDERVRGNPKGKYPKSIPSHWVMRELLMKWDDPTVYSSDQGKTWKKKTGIMEPLHVGIALNCRCVPQPFWGDKIKKVDSDIGGQA